MVPPPLKRETNVLIGKSRKDCKCKSPNMSITNSPNTNSSIFNSSITNSPNMNHPLHRRFHLSGLVGLPILSCAGTFLPIPAEAIKPSHRASLLPLWGRNWKRVKLVQNPHHHHCRSGQFSGPSVCIPCFIVIDLIIRRVRGPLGSTSIVTRFPEYVCTTLPPPSSIQNSSFLTYNIMISLSWPNSTQDTWSFWSKLWLTQDQDPVFC